MSLSIESLTKKFGDVSALDGIDLEVEDGEVVALLGPSGCGKTTTLRCVAGLETPTSGSISVDDSLVYSSRYGRFVSPEERGIGLVFQTYALWPHMTIFENVAYGLRVQRMARGDIESRVSEILENVELGGFGPRYPATLSGGQQQRVALARSLVLEPKILLFDEPLSNLDLKLRESMRRDLRTLVKRIGLTSIYVTHDQSEAMVIADRVVLMNHGRIEQQGEPKELYERPRTRFAADFLGSANFLDAEGEGWSDDRYGLRTSGGALLWSRSEIGDSGAGACVAIRPERISIGSQGSSPQANVLKGTVSGVEFLGNCTFYDVRCEGMELRVQTSQHHLALGAAITISIEPVDVLVLEKESSDV